MIETELLERPEGIDSALWDASSPGERVRMLRRAEERMPLPVKVYAELHRLPEWVFYGPELGVPDDWFGDDGFLLPRFRPGGPDHESFDLWRREYRRRRWIAFLLRQRWKRFWVDNWFWAQPAVWGSGFLIAAAAFERLTRGYGEGEKLAWVIGLTVAAAMVFRVILFLSALVRLEPRLVMWSAARLAQRRPLRLSQAIGTRGGSDRAKAKG